MSSIRCNLTVGMRRIGAPLAKAIPCRGVKLGRNAGLNDAVTKRLVLQPKEPEPTSLNQSPCEGPVQNGTVRGICNGQFLITMFLASKLLVQHRASEANVSRRVAPSLGCLDKPLQWRTFCGTIGGGEAAISIRMRSLGGRNADRDDRIRVTDV